MAEKQGKKDAKAKPHPALLARADELARSGNYEYLYQIERALIQEGFTGAPGFKVDDREKLRAILKGPKRGS